MGREFSKFQVEKARLDEYSKEVDAWRLLEEAFYLQTAKYKEDMDIWLPHARETEFILQEWAAVLRYGCNYYERAEVLASVHELGDVRMRVDVQGVMRDGPFYVIPPKMMSKADTCLYSAIIDKEYSEEDADFMAASVGRSSYDAAGMDWLKVGFEWFDMERCFVDEHGAAGLSCCLGCELGGFGSDCFSVDDNLMEEMRISANAVVGGGLRLKKLTKAQLARKKQRNKMRLEAFQESLVQRDPFKVASSYSHFVLTFFCHLLLLPACCLPLNPKP